MYFNILIGEWRWLAVTIHNKTYLLGRTGRFDWCQDLASIMRRV